MMLALLLPAAFLAVQDNVEVVSVEEIRAKFGMAYICMPTKDSSGRTGSIDFVPGPNEATLRFKVRDAADTLERGTLTSAKVVTSNKGKTLVLMVDGYAKGQPVSLEISQMAPLETAKPADAILRVNGAVQTKFGCVTTYPMPPQRDSK